MDSGRSHSIWHYFQVGSSVSDLNIISILVAQGRRPLDCGEWSANSKNQDEWDHRSTVTRTERKPHRSWCFGNSPSGRVLWENRCLMLVNSHRIFFFSLTYGSVLWYVKCTAPSSCAVAPTDMKARYFFFWPVLGLFCSVLFCLFETREGYSLEWEAQLLIVVASFVVKHRP